MIIQKPIKEIVEIIAGYAFRTAIYRQTGGNLAVISAKNITNDLVINANKLDRTEDQNINTKAFVKKNDVILSVRGKFKAGVFKGMDNKAIATASVYVLRIKDSNILSDYLAIYLNSAIGQKQIRQSMTSGIISTMLRKDLASIIVSIPNLEEQQKIIELYYNNTKMQRLLDQKKQITGDIVEGALYKLINI